MARLLRFHALAIVIIVGCGPDNPAQPTGDEPERYAKAYCSASSDCGCQPRYGDAHECSEQMTRRFSDALDDGFKLDVECFEKVVENGELDECTPVKMWSYDDWYCPVLRGSKKHHESCDGLPPALPPFDVDECEKGLRCIDQICVTYDEVGPIHAQGDACAPQEPLSCHSSGLYCSPSGFCEQGPLLGEACTSNEACLASKPGVLAYCAGLGSGAGACAASGAEGAACDPRDSLGCQGEDASVYGWCDPSTSTCRASGPAICLADDYAVSHRPAL